MPRRLGVSFVLVPLLAAGCGNSRTPAPSLTKPATPKHFHTLRYPSTGLAIAVPTGWTLIREHRPLVIVAASGGAVVALWRYVNVAPVPATKAALGRARRALIAAVRARHPHIELISSRTLKINRRPAIVLETIAHIGGLKRRVRSVHLFAPGEEIVLEEYAPVALFPSVSREVFVPVRRSLVITTP